MADVTAYFNFSASVVPQSPGTVQGIHRLPGGRISVFYTIQVPQAKTDAAPGYDESL
jgi:hypothetical protein